jgi:uncharacterized membrane protein YccC
MVCRAVGGDMTPLLHSSSIRYSLSAWLATVLALITAFILQLEPAQWCGITVWILFMQSPRLNYSKIIWWVFGTVTGALVAVVLIALFSQSPDLFLGALATYLAICAAAGALVRSYRAYGAVLAGYTCAIVSMSAADNPSQVFHLAIMRVSCIFVGMVAAVIVMAVMLPPQGHWRDTVHQLSEYLKATLHQVAHALHPAAAPSALGWRHVVDRLATIEHTLDVTTAETPESRLRSKQARSLVATLCCLLAKAQSIEIHRQRHALHSIPENLFARTATILDAFAQKAVAEKAEIQAAELVRETTGLREDVATLSARHHGDPASEKMSDRFILDRLGEILEELEEAVYDWAGLYGSWKPRRPSCVAQHRDYYTAALHALRVFVALGMASGIWFMTQWPSGPMLILFICIVLALLSLQENAPDLGFSFLKSATFCACVAYVDAFWVWQKAEGLGILVLSLGVFLVPGAYAYRHPRLLGSSVVSMLIFYGLANPANQMTYDISAFLNNGLALLTAAACGFLSFHIVPTLTPQARRILLLRSMRRELASATLQGGFVSEQRWTACTFDRLRLLHRANNQLTLVPDDSREDQMLTGLQLGLRQIRLRELLDAKDMNREVAREIHGVFRHFRTLARHPERFAGFLRTTCEGLHQRFSGITPIPESHLQVVAELQEMTLLLEARELLPAA